MSEDLKNLDIRELRELWSQLWSRTPHTRMGRTMLEKSILYKQREQQGLGLTPEQKAHLDQLVQQYKNNPKCFDVPSNPLKPGVRLVRMYKEKKYCVVVQPNYFEYRDLKWFSLCAIANDITGTKTDGWKFFGIKR